MATEYPALNRIHVVGYSANDTDYPILNLVADPRVAGYKVPEDFSICPDKRYPNHIFTGAQPISGDQRVRHVWEILPSPWVPFTRYDDDLGPIQGRRRAVKNEGQKASLTSSTKISYEGREGSSIVLNELEETWEIKVDEDGNSLFPIKIRDFYDASRGAVEERRQLFVPTGEEVATLENNNGIITQTSYEPYNEYLSYKIVQTYAVNGPQLVGQITDSDRQLATVTTQRKASDNYVAPQPTATRTVEVSREDAESLIERVVDTPSVFGSKVFRRTREDLTPPKFRASQVDTTSEENVAGTASIPTLATGEFSRSEQQVNAFVKRVSLTSRDVTSSKILTEKVLTNEGQIGTRTLTLSSGNQSFTPSATLIDANVEALGDGRTVKTEVTVNNVFDEKQVSLEKPDVIPPEFRATLQNKTSSETKSGTSAEVQELADNEVSKTVQRITDHKIRETVVIRPETDYPSLSDELIDNNLIKVNRTKTLVKGEQTITPSATVSGTVEAIGDGYTLKTEDTKEEVFDERVLSVQRPDVIPPQFTANIPSVTTQTVISKTSAEIPILDQIDLEKREERLTAFTVRESKTSREQNSFPKLLGQDYDPSVDLVVPFSEEITQSGTSLSSNNTFVDPLSDDFDLVRTIDVDAVKSKLDSILLEFPTRSNLSIPPILKSIKVVWDSSVDNGSYDSDFTGSSEGQSVSLSGDTKGQARASAEVIPSFEVEIEDVWANNIPTTSYFFFLPYPVTLQDILNKVGAQQWPVFKPKAHNISALRQKKTIDLNVDGSTYASGSNSQRSQSKTEGSGESISIDNTTVSLKIPPTIHGAIIISETGEKTKSVQATANVYMEGGNMPTVSLFKVKSDQVNGRSPSNLPATNPADIPRSGKYLIDSRVELYQYGYAKVYAEVLDASIFA